MEGMTLQREMMPRVAHGEMKILEIMFVTRPRSPKFTHFSKGWGIKEISRVISFILSISYRPVDGFCVINNTLRCLRSYNNWKT